MITNSFIRYSVLFLLLACCSTVKSQNKGLPSDSLKKFSYTIFGTMVANGKAVLDMGTCFFLRKNGNLVLVTAKHVLYDCDSSTQIMTPKFRNASVFLPNGFEFINFTVPEIKDTCVLYYKDPDLIVLSIDNKWMGKVNTVDKFILPPFRKFGRLTLFGQGMKGDNSTYLRFDEQHNIELKEKKFKFYTNTPTPDSTYLDTIHYFVETREVVSGSWMKGFSGSPVFLQEEKTKKWRLCGVFVQSLYKISDELPGGLILVNPNYMTSFIDATFEKINSTIFKH